MGSRTTSPPAEPSSPTDGGIRKRVCKACDRCRLKKSKCDGATPCSRCKADNAICVFGERKKSHDKVYPKGYVEMLEHQQTQLVSGLQELYRRLQAGDGWTGAPLKESAHGAPLTHDLLEQLGALKEAPQSGADHFEENLDALQSRLLTTGSESAQRESSFDANSETDMSSVFDPVMPYPTFTNPFPSAHFPPTPPTGSPHASIVKTSSPLKAHMSISTLPYVPSNQWQPELYHPETMDFDISCITPPLDANVQNMSTSSSLFHDPTSMGINPQCLTTKGWHTDNPIFPYFQGGAFT